MSNNPAQITASDPDISVWVSASAGTGKTRILTNRVLRLLLSGVSLDKILCLTFTKAAAKEMDHRITSSLRDWSDFDSDKLKESLYGLLGREATKGEFLYAPSLFKQKLNANISLKIQTIHSFCQFILDKFPIEASVSPGFRVVDEFKSAEIINNIRTNIISKAHLKSNELKEAINFIAGNMHDIKMHALIEEIVRQKVKFQILLQKYNIEDYSKYLELKYLDPNFDIVSIIKNIGSVEYYDAEERDVIKLSKYNELIRDIGSNIDELQLLFLTKENKARKSFVLKKWRTDYPDEFAKIEEIQNAFLEYAEQEQSKNLITYTKYLFILSKYILEDYEYYKRIYGYLDYDDLIIKARNLLVDADSREWVLYKIDGGIDHILLDEAQDTSKEQWEIIEAITSEFYSGMGGTEENRTLFVVGDEKQSIYSFQGADPKTYKAMNEYFAYQMKAADKIYKNIDLDLSYRSLPAITSFVSEAFKDTQDFPNAVMDAYRKEDEGEVALWPLIFDEREEVAPWPLPIKSESLSSYEKLAEEISEYIKNTIGTNLKSKNRPIHEGDFLILVRKRTEFIGELISKLKNKDIAVAGIDRIRMCESEAIIDILSLAKFVLLPEDDLNLAIFLKSPFIELNEKELYDLCVVRGKLSLYEFIVQNNKELADRLNIFRKKYLDYNLSEFFFNIIEIEKYRAKLVAYHHQEAHDAINEFLELSNNFYKNEINSLQHFIFWLENSDVEIKRDLDSSDAVRIMTVHGAKGLQSKIVILVDKVTAHFPHRIFLWDEEGHVLWPGNSNNYNREYTRLLDEKKKKEYDEYMRLLYVALTRAEDNLQIAGYSGSKIDNKSWYYTIKRDRII